MDYKKLFWTLGLSILSVGVIVAVVLFNPRWIVNTGGVKVYEEEALIYLRLTLMEYEEIAGENVWDLSPGGRDAFQMAADNALDSVIRVKLVQPDNGVVSQSVHTKLSAKVVELKEKLGEAWIKKMDISDVMLYRILAENYWAAEFESKLKYDAGDIAKDIDARVENAFAEYNDTDTEIYLQKVRLQSIMCYTGEWVEGVWIQYPEERQKEKQILMEEVSKRIKEGEDFSQLCKEYNEMREFGNPLFSQGIFKNRDGGFFYRGQIYADLVEQIFRLSEGQCSEVIETEYGYLIVKVQKYPERSEQDLLIYKNTLANEKLEYRNELIATLRKQKIEEEVERLRQGTRVEVQYTEWDKILREYVEEEVYG